MLVLYFTARWHENGKRWCESETKCRSWWNQSTLYVKVVEVGS